MQSLETLQPIAAAHHEFDRLQRKLRDRWLHINQFDTAERHILVIPSMSLDQQELQKIDGVHPL